MERERVALQEHLVWAGCGKPALSFGRMCQACRRDLWRPPRADLARQPYARPSLQGRADECRALGWHWTPPGRREGRESHRASTVSTPVKARCRCSPCTSSMCGDRGLLAASTLPRQFDASGRTFE